MHRDVFLSAFLATLTACYCPPDLTGSGGAACELAPAGAPLCGGNGTEPCASDADCPGLGRYCRPGTCADGMGCGHDAGCAPQFLPGDACTRDGECCSSLCSGGTCAPKQDGDPCPP